MKNYGANVSQSVKIARTRSLHLAKFLNRKLLNLLIGKTIILKVLIV